MEAILACLPAPIHGMTELGGNVVLTMTYVHRANIRAVPPVTFSLANYRCRIKVDLCSSSFNFLCVSPGALLPFLKNNQQQSDLRAFVHTSLHVEEADFSAGVADDTKIIFQQLLQVPVMWFQQCLFRS